jgi:hypothetical protein
MLLSTRERAGLELHYARSATVDLRKSPDVVKLETLLDAVNAQWAAVDPASTDLLPALNRATQVLGQLLKARVSASDVLDNSGYSVEQWRKSAFIDARSILEERDRYRRVEAALPLGTQEMKPHGH